MTREEAIEVVKKNWPDSRYTILREAIETLIPELRESKDDRIRKAILGLTYLDGIEPILTKCSITAGDIRAWIKKQKEQKSTEWDELQADFKNINGAFEDGKKEVIAHPEKYGLCKSTTWSTEDEEALRELLNILSRRELYLSDDSEWLSFKLKNWFKSFRPHWKPSEEQMNAIDYVLRYDKTGEFRDALKSLYDQLYNMHKDV